MMEGSTSFLFAFLARPFLRRVVVVLDLRSDFEASAFFFMPFGVD
jgi:hypothetical protein